MGKETETIYILNPEYELRRDKNRIIIVNKTIAIASFVRDFMGFVHPIYAIILSFFDGEKKLEQVLAAATALLRKDQSFISNIIEPLLENEEALHFHYDGYHFSFPEKLLVKRDDGIIPIKYRPEDFFIPKQEMDLESRRLHYPLDILFMVNTRCVTDCIYCYADRTKKMDCQIPLKRLKELIKEAKSLNMRSFDITGGELFLYEHWEEFLAELLANGFVPYISTKCPIKPETIKKLTELGIKRIQISIDSIIKEELMQLLSVKEDYYHQLLETIKNLDESDIEIYTNTQFTSINTGHAEDLINYLLDLKNIKRINMGAAGYSLYKCEKDYLEYKPLLKEIKRIEAHVNELKEKYVDKVNINFSGYIEKASILNKNQEESEKDFKARARCSGNFYAFFILPDGKVTICEELYWHPKFVIGDLTKQSIEEVWNSRPALELYNISQDIVSAKSPCKTCSEFEPCHKNQGVCWKQVLYAYGYDNWDYADPKCPYASKPIRKYYI